MKLNEIKEEILYTLHRLSEKVQERIDNLLSPVSQIKFYFHRFMEINNMNNVVVSEKKVKEIVVSYSAIVWQENATTMIAYLYTDIFGLPAIGYLYCQKYALIGTDFSKTVGSTIYSTTNPPIDCETKEKAIDEIKSILEGREILANIIIDKKTKSATIETILKLNKINFCYNLLND